jgi:tetratricopeptide (TPR) repeat protein
MKDLLSGKVPLFLTQEKALKRILQERERGDMPKARKTAVEALEKWPDDYDLAIEAAQTCLDLSDYPQAANILKNAHKRHANRRNEIIEFARSAFIQSSSTLLGSFIIETLIKGRNIDGVADLLQASPESFVGDLTKRGEARSKNLADDDQERSPIFAENELLLGMLYKSSKQFEKSVTSLGRALEILPTDAQAIGALLVQIEHELPAHVLVKFYLGLASLLLAHPDKAEARFFQCLELDEPPLEKILSALAAAETPCPNQDLLKGEILTRSGNTAEGAAAIRAYISNDPTPATERGNAPPQDERMKLAEERLAMLPGPVFASPDIAFLYCDVATRTGLVKEAIAVLERIAANEPARTGAIIEWLEKNETASLTAPGQNLLARAYLESGAFDKCIRATRGAADMNAALVTSLIELFRRKTEEKPDCDPRLKALLAELYARSLDRTSAEEIFGALKRTRALASGDLVSLSGEIMRHCGMFLTGVLSTLEISLASGNCTEATAHVVAFCRENPEEHENLASSIRDLAEEHGEYWSPIAELVDHLAKEERLSEPLRFLQAAAHLFTGEVERSIFEFDQILMLNGDLKYRAIELYKKALARFETNATLHLALYHLYLEEELLAEAAHHLCRTLELDPNQIRDVIARFGKLVEKEPGNLGIWEEMLRTALAMNRTSLAKEVLTRAISMLPQEKAAALHVYGARISAADGNWDDALQCIALTLTSAEADVSAIEGELRAIIARDPANPQAQFLLGEALMRLGKDAEAVSAIRRCLDLSPALRQSVKEKLERLLPLSIEPWLLSGILGELAWLEGNQDEAFRHFASAQKGSREALAALSVSLERIRAMAAEDARLELLYARNLSLEGRDADAVAILERLIAKDASLTRTTTDILLSIITERPEQIDANRLLSRICIRSGDVELSRQAVVRILSDERADPARVDAVVSEFLGLHEGNAEFLVHYAGLKARRGEMEAALARYRTALEREASRSEIILAALERHVWPQELRDTERILRVDCLIAARRDNEAFALLGDFPGRDHAVAREFLARLTLLIANGPRCEYFSLGASLLAQCGDIEEVERFIMEGCASLGKDDALTLTIELAEILHNAGRLQHGARLFAEALEAATAKAPVLKRIEQSYTRWADREITSLMARFDGGGAGEADVVRLVRLVLDHTGPDRALEILSRSAVPRAMRSALLGSIYLSMDRPALACAALGAGGDGDPLPDDEMNDQRYNAGLARERAGDFGRAAALFAAIAADRGDFRDSRARALRNYTRFLETRFEERPIVLEKSEVI